MLFTDIEGSTVLLRALGPAYGQVLSDQRRIMRAAIATHAGHEMGTEGDSFFVVFDSPAAGIAAAVDAQRGLHTNAWPDGHAVRVRMGLHLGAPVRHEEGYMGLDLNRAARIASTANGAQIVVSAAVCDAVGSMPGLTVRDLGQHRLKDLPEPEHLYQLVVDGLPDVTTPIKSLGAPTNLPTPRTALVGRDREVDDAARLVAGGARLVTLTGAGGVGKTTLSLAIAARLDTSFPGGVYFVALEHAREAPEAWRTIAAALGTEGDEEAPRSTVAMLSGAPALLVLDNLEQLTGAATVVGELLDRSRCSVIATSRGPLHLRGEHRYPVEPLAVPARDHTLGAIRALPAVELFVREATRARPSFTMDESNAPTVLAICANVEGLPLALELVASRVRTLSLDAILASLDRRLTISSRDADRPDRHRTLNAAVAWSCELLVDDLRDAFARLSVFSGGATVDAAMHLLEPTCEGDPLDTLEALADVSLIDLVDGPDGGTRVTMLGVVRDVASRRLDESGTAGDVRRRHAAYYADFAEDAEQRLHGPEQLVWADRLAAEHENLRAAFDWAMSSPDDMALAVRAAAALGWFWYTHGRAAEGRTWLERASSADQGIEPAIAAKAVHALGVLQQQQGENTAAAASFERALGLWRAVDDTPGVARALNSLGIALWADGQPEHATAHLVESVALARSAGDERRIAAGLSNLGVVLLTTGRIDEAVDALHEALELDRGGGDAWAVAVDQTNLGAALVRRGQVHDGHSLVADTLPIVVDLDDPDLLASALEACATAAGASGDSRLAVTLAAGADRVRADASVPRPPADDAYLERELGPARAALGSSAGAAADRGWHLPLDDLVALARTPLGRP